MKIEWYLSCSVKEARNLIKENIDGPLVPPFMGKNFQGFSFGNSFTIWNKHEGIGNRTAVAKVKLTETPNGTKLEAKTSVVFPSNIAPSSPKFYYVAVPLTIALWVTTAVSMVLDKIQIVMISGPLAGVGIVFMILGFSKMMGSGNIVFLDKFFKKTLLRYRKDEKKL
jgi:hypothetical protein